MRKPRNGICLATACRMLNQIVFACAVNTNVRRQFFNCPQLVVTREDNRFFLRDLAGVSIFYAFLLYKYKPLDEQDDLLFCPNVLPHIGNIDYLFTWRVSFLSGVSAAAMPAPTPLIVF